MSIWFCPTCNKLTAFNRGICPVCGGSTSFATLTAHDTPSRLGVYAPNQQAIVNTAHRSWRDVFRGGQARD